MKASTLGAAVALLGGAASALAAPARHAPSGRKPPPAAPAPKPRPPPPDLPGPLGIARVHVEVGEERVHVTTELTIPRGDWARSDLDAFVAFGAPGLPQALDARLCATPPGFLVAPDATACTPLALATEPRAPAHVAFSLGRRTMAGELVHLPADALARALAPSGVATLVLREVRPLPPRTRGGAREVLVRLGATGGSPWALGIVEVVAEAGAEIVEADARLCGANVDESPVALLSPVARRTASDAAPPLAPRTTTDDLCVRFR